MTIKRTVNNGKGTQPKLERNLEIYKEYQSGIDTVEIAHKYGISHARVYAIINQIKRATNST